MIRFLLPLILFVLAFPGLRMFSNLFFPNISLPVFALAYFSLALFFMGAVIAAELLLSLVNHFLYLRDIEKDHEYYEHEEGDEDDDEDFEEEHAPAIHDKDGRPYCPDCHAYLDEKGGYYAANRAERRRLKREGSL